MKKKIYVSTSFRNCMNNNYLTAQIRSFVEVNDCELVGSAEESDYIVITTCGFDQPREDHSKEMIRQFSEEFPQKQVIVSGCLPGILPSFGDGMDNVMAINTDKLEKFDELFDAKTTIDSVVANVFEDLVSHKGPSGLYSIEISKGCTERCSYCVIWKTKGRHTSKPIDEVVAEIKIGLEQGYDRFCFLSDNCSIYGTDIDTDLAELLNRVDEIEGDFRVLLYYAEPKRFADVFPKISKSAFERVCYLDLPTQSASPEVLAKMRRYYTSDEVIKLVREIKTLSSDVVLGTHILFGFPSESIDDFWESLSLSSHFDQVTFFPYSDRPKSIAERFPDKVSQHDIDERTAIVKQFIQGNPRMQLMSPAEGGPPAPPSPPAPSLVTIGNGAPSNEAPGAAS